MLITGTDPREKGAALALRAAALVRRGREAAALADVRNALDYCVVSGSVLPFAAAAERPPVVLRRDDRRLPAVGVDRGHVRDVPGHRSPGRGRVSSICR
ncbi:hypothetical protein IOD13_02795 [Brevibacterium casei]|nr:hypothetical protein [Brevibacterium casei]